jgi:hypothetical protein
MTWDDETNCPDPVRDRLPQCICFFSCRVRHHHDLRTPVPSYLVSSTSRPGSTSGGIGRSARVWTQQPHQLLERPACSHALIAGCIFSPRPPVRTSDSPAPARRDRQLEIYPFALPVPWDTTRFTGPVRPPGAGHCGHRPLARRTNGHLVMPSPPPRPAGSHFQIHRPTTQFVLGRNPSFPPLLPHPNFSDSLKRVGLVGCCRKGCTRLNRTWRNYYYHPALVPFLKKKFRPVEGSVRGQQQQSFTRRVRSSPVPLVILLDACQLPYIMGVQAMLPSPAAPCS